MASGSISTDSTVCLPVITEVVTKHFGASYDFRLTLGGNGSNGGGDPKPSQTSPLVRTALGMGARIVEETVE